MQKKPGKELSVSLGFAGFYREFFPGFAEVTANLNELKINKL